MCGIAGIFDLGGRWEPAAASALVKRMTERASHRGPDASGLWSSDDRLVHLGHRRLSILDLSTDANQPMIDRTGRYAISFNGEIYNFKALKADLEERGHTFVTNCDTEVLLAGFIEFGTRVFGRLDGMFALAIYDSENRRLTLARDAAGEKPLYYVLAKGHLIFASELTQVLAAAEDGLSFELSDAGLTEFLMLRYAAAPRTVVDGVNKLEPGKSLTIDWNGQGTEERFFDFTLDDSRQIHIEHMAAYAEDVRQLLMSAITDRLNSDVPLGFFLSGGVDSALVCALLTKELKQRPKTFSVGFEGDQKSEHMEAAAIAKTLGTEHHEFVFTAKDFDNACENIGHLLDEPNGDRSCVPTYLLSGFAREHVTVAISGDGGDELFGGYGRYAAVGTQVFDPMRMDPAFILKAYFEQMLPVFPLAVVQSAFDGSAQVLEDFIERYKTLFMHPERPIFHSLRMLDFATYLPGAVLSKVDRMSMQHGLEVRTPYLYGPLMKLASHAGLDLCLDGKKQKLALRSLLANYLPDEHASAPKRGFGMPQSVFINNKERVTQELRNSEEILAASHFFGQRKESLTRIMGSAGRNINTAWAVIVLAKWLNASSVRF